MCMVFLLYGYTIDGIGETGISTPSFFRTRMARIARIIRWIRPIRGRFLSTRITVNDREFPLIILPV